MNNAKKWLVAAVVVVGLGGSGVWAASSDYKDVAISVTPVSNVTLTLTGLTSWAIGNQDVGTSTVSFTAAHLTNTGNIDVSATSQITANTGNWTASLSSGTVDNYTLYVATSSVAPNPNGLTFNAGTAIANVGATPALKGLSGGAAPNMTASGGAVDLWFRLDMPTKISGAGARSMTVRFTGTAL